jgi:enamine deaminase RidA (YjgF/YER057c/UK114 family)
VAIKREKKSTKKTRRQALAAGLAVFGGAGVAKATAAEAQTTAPGAGSWTPKKEVIRRPGQAASANAPSANAPSANAPLLSSCIRSGHLLFVAGIGGWYPDRRKEAGDIKVQIQSALTTMKEILEAAGSSMANVLKVHMTVAEPNKNIALLNEGYRGFFPDPPPARSYTGTAANLMGREGVLVQVDCVAYVD